MEKRIELEKRGRNPATIKDLNLDNCRSTQIIGLDDYINLESLSLINAGLVTLKGFPKLPRLRKLELSDNRISGGLNLIQNSPKLTHLNLSGNKIKDIGTLQPLETFKHLKNLDLFNCEVTVIENYREKVFELIDSLKYLDGYDRNDVEAEDSEDEDANEDDDDDNEDGESEDDDDDEEDEDEEEDGVVDEEGVADDEGAADDEGVVDEEDEDEDDDLEVYADDDDDDDVSDLEGDEREEESPRGQKRKRNDIED